MATVLQDPSVMMSLGSPNLAGRSLQDNVLSSGHLARESVCPGGSGKEPRLSPGSNVLLQTVPELKGTCEHHSHLPEFQVKTEESVSTCSRDTGW